MPDGPASEERAVRWPPRVRKPTIRRLYASIPSGLLNEELVDEVGISLLMRCQAILTIHKASRGEVLCPTCDRAGRETYIRRGSHAPEEQLQCPSCGWKVTWGDYHRTFQRKQFNMGGAGPAFRRFVDEYPRCRTPWEKMLAIDFLIHQFHFSLRSDPTRPTRAACVNLIEGKLADVVALLDEISGVAQGRAELSANVAEFRKNCANAGESHPK